MAAGRKGGRTAKRRRSRKAGQRPRKATPADREKSLIAAQAIQTAFPEAAEASYVDGLTLSDFQDSVKRSLWLAVSVYRLATAISNIGIKVIRSDTRDEAAGTKAKAIRRIIRRPNLDETYSDLVEMNMIHLGLAGETYLEKVRNGAGEVVELWTWNPKKVTPTADKTGNRRIASYVFRMGMKDVSLSADEVISVRVYNPNDPLRGMSMVSPMYQDVLGDQAAARMNKAALQRGGRIGGVLSPNDGSLGTEEFRLLEAQMRLRHEGPENTGRWMLLPAELTFQEAASTNKDMDFLNLRKFSREIAAGAMGVPPMVIGNFDSATYANATEQLRGFWDYVAKPWLKKILGSITEQWIRPEIDENLELAADLAQIDALVDNQSARTQNVFALVQGGIMMINEGRKEMGLPPLPDGDKLLVPLNLTPSDPTELQAPEPEPPPEEPAPAPSDTDQVEDDDDREEALSITLRKQADRDTARAAHEDQLVRAERKLARRVFSYLKSSRNRILERVRVQGDGSVDVDFVVGNKDVEANEAREALVSAILETVQDAGDLTLSRLGMDKMGLHYRRKVEAPERLPELLDLLGAFDIENPRILAYLQEFFLTHLDDLTSGTLEDVRSSLKGGLELGEGINQLVLRIEVLPCFDALRAEKVARTETIGAFNLGAQEAFRAAETPRKSWLVTQDERARESHLAADSTYRANPIPVTEKFILSESRRGSAEIAFPGDPEAPAWAVVNCRCAMLPEDEAQLSVWVAHCKAELEEVYA